MKKKGGRLDIFFKKRKSLGNKILVLPRRSAFFKERLSNAGRTRKETITIVSLIHDRKSPRKADEGEGKRPMAA